MVFRGYFGLDGAELANTARLIAHIQPGTPTSDAEVGQLSCVCDLEVGYDDSWPGLPATLGHDPYVITNAPWYDAARPESAEFAGVWVMDVTGLDSVPVARTVNEAICSGGVAGLARDSTRTLTFSALLVACSNAGVRYGINWLACRLRTANARRGAVLDLWSAHPSGTAASPASLRRTMQGLVLTSSPAVVDVAAKGGFQHRQASAWRVEWSMVALSPYLYATGTTLPVVWDSTATESITWAHAPNCSGPGSCDLPTIFNADCTPPDVPIDLAAPPTCGGCLPLCSIDRRTWEMPAIGSSCNETVVSVRVTNTDLTDNLTVNMVWRPCGSVEQCDEVFPLQVSGLAPGDVAVADSVTGRPYVTRDGVAHRQVGVVSTQRGAPWSPMVIDATQCWELVAESAPGATYTVEVVLQGRDA